MGKLTFCALVSLLLAGAACTTNNLGGSAGGEQDGGSSVHPPLPGLVALTVAPKTTTLTVDAKGPPQSAAFTATGRFADATERDVTDEVNWALDNRAIGAVDTHGRFTTSNQAGGNGTITAASGVSQASAALTVNLTATLRSPEAPANADQLLPPLATGAVLAGRSPVIIYPSDQTIVPVNMFKVLFQWSTGTGNDLFRLELRGPQVVVSVYTTLDRYEPTAAEWALLARSAAGGEVTWTVYGTARSAPSQVYRSAPVRLGFSRSAVEGAIYYWSTSGAGIRRATVSDQAPTDFLTPTQTGKCVACHTLSRNGQRLAADVGGQTLGVVAVRNPSPPVISWTQDIDTAWTTFSPDTSLVVTANKGVLTLRSGSTGAAMGTVPVGAGKFGTQPDWSPSGKLLAFAFSTSNKDRGVTGSSIALASFDGAAFAAPRVLVASSGANDTLVYPNFSADSAWVAYVRATGSSDNNATARVYLVAVSGGAPIELGAANTIVNNAVVTGKDANLADNMPTWAPTKAGDLAFLAFTSQRAYGKVYPANDVKQIWVSAIDLAGAASGTGKDPSAPAFRLPFQELKENNHRPFWAEDALAPPPAPDGGVGGVDGGACLPLHGDCRSGAACCAPNVCSFDGVKAFTCEAPLG